MVNNVDGGSQYLVYGKTHYQRNKKEYIEKARARWKRNISFLFEYKKSHPCVDCGESDPIVLDFDHGDNDQKERDLSIGARNGWSISHLLEEVAKCEIRCSNCHRRKSQKQFSWYKDIASFA